MSSHPPPPVPDPRHISNGWRIPNESYCDQPYVVKTDDGAWLCTMTTGSGIEGQPGQHVISMRSTDMGRTWSSPVDVEPGDGPEASYSVMLKVPSGRVYVFYNHNTDNLRAVKGDPAVFKDGLCGRVDSLGHYVFKYSDDHGRTWSRERFPIPVRAFDIDLKNSHGGAVRFFWNVGKPFTFDGAGYMPLIKVGGFGVGFFTSSEGVLLRSDNILTERDPLNIRWETLPEGQIGLRTPPGGGPVAEEHSYSLLSDGSIFVVYRSTDGHPVCSYSRDGGRTFETPRYMTFADGRVMKHPRAANFAWRCSNGRFLYWFHNHGGRFIPESIQRTGGGGPYEDRNPVWLCGGVETDGPTGRQIAWSQPEIILYDDDSYVRMSYPDLVEADGRYFITETQKETARTHEIDASLINGLWSQLTDPAPVGKPTTDGMILEKSAPDVGTGEVEFTLPQLPYILARHGACGKDLRAGFTLDLSLQFPNLDAGRVLLDSRDGQGSGITLTTTPRRTLELRLSDGRTCCTWECDEGVLRAGVMQHVSAIIDGGPKIISFIMEGLFNDGGSTRQFGWGRFSPNLRHANSAARLRVAAAVKHLRVYNRALRVSEVIANHRAAR